MNAFWYGGDNFGDIMTPLLVEKLSGALPELSRGPGTTFMVGSILHRLWANCVVWGSGAASPKHITRPFPEGVRILAVRGPLTLQALLDAGCRTVPLVYGDPAILLPILFPRRLTAGVDLGVVLHYSDKGKVAVPRGAMVIDPCRPPLDVVADICRCRRVASSSLHGLIVAEAYGARAAWVQVDGGERLVGRGFKFCDYILSTNRLPVVSSFSSGETISEERLHWLPKPTLNPGPLLAAYPFPRKSR